MVAARPWARKSVSSRSRARLGAWKSDPGRGRAPPWPLEARLGPVRTPIGGPGVALSAGLGRQNPDSCRASESTAHEVAQIEPGGAEGEPRMVLDGAAVAEFEAAAAEAGDLGDDPFHVGPVLAVLLPQFGLAGPVAAGLAQQVISLVQNDFPAGLGLCAPLEQWAVAAQRTEAGHPGPAERADVTGRALHCARVLVDSEVVDGEPTIHRCLQRFGFDHGLVGVGVVDRAA